MKKETRTLNQRLKKGELYIVFTGSDYEEGTNGFICYGDPERTPRIYGRGRLDERVGDIPVCKNVKSANKRIGSDTYAALVPLSSMMDGHLLACFRPYEVRQWAAAQREVVPVDVLKYVAKWVKENPPERHGDREYAERHVVFAHGGWISKNPNGTLGELLEFLDSVRYEMRRYDGDELIADHIDDLCDAAIYLADFGDDEDDDLPDFDYRMGNVDEDIGHVEQLIAFDGDSSRVADLPTQEELLNQNRKRKLAG